MQKVSKFTIFILNINIAYYDLNNKLWIKTIFSKDVKMTIKRIFKQHKLKISKFVNENIPFGITDFMNFTPKIFQKFKILKVNYSKKYNEIQRLKSQYERR